ncbi:MAG: hypothetical protein JSV91_13615 [Phycisphaerales bacterium]|nr:MAG: hypothetical protein JSV91_13615 [Phycisphaerales bacterium]
MKYGYFDNENREYVIDRADVPVSWTNYLGLESMCTVLSHNAGGYSFFRSAQHGRITRFRPNGVPLDRPGRYVYLRDDQTGEYWSVSWQPVGNDLDKAKYECRHGLSYSIFKCRYRGIEASQRVFIPLGDDVELWDVRIANKTRRRRSISVFSYIEFSLHNVDLDNQDFQMGLYASGASCRNGIIECDFHYAPGMQHFFASSFEPDSYDCVREEFIGPYRTETDPIAVERGKCSDSARLTGNHCGALHKRCRLKPGGEIRLIFMLGMGPRKKIGTSIRRRYSSLANVDKAFARLRAYWDEKLSVLQCDTPHDGMNTMINVWNPYQAQTCATWSRFASFIEVGGRTGLGFRDTAQDAMNVVHSSPNRAKQRLIELLQGQTSAGFGLHLFDPLTPGNHAAENPGLPTILPSTTSAKPINVKDLSDVCSDDALWLVAAICEYLKETGDTGFLDQVVPFADRGSETVYEHMKLALDFSAKHVGEKRICKGLRADWNDCLHLGDGESAMVSFLHHWTLLEFVELAEFLAHTTDLRKYATDARKYRTMAEKVEQACERVLWDGKWFLRGFSAAGREIGTAADRQGKLFLNAQTWAVCSGLADEDRGRQGMDAVRKHLFTPYGLHLMWPAYTKPDDEVGFITRVYPGVKENGSIFSHANTWAVIAECILGRGDRAFEYYRAMLPCEQNDIIETRQAEPYSYCQFIMGKAHELHGRARHPWLTGSAGWFLRAATRWILGVHPTIDGLIIDPCIPKEWEEFQVTRKWRGATYRISVTNPLGVEKGVRSVLLNGTVVVGQWISPQPAGSINEVQVTMG